MKIEDVNYANQEAYFARQRNFSNRAMPRNNFQNNFSGGNVARNQPSNFSGGGVQRNASNNSRKRGRNPLDQYGNVIRCHYCDSINHLNNACPDRQQRQQQRQSQQQYPNRTYFETAELQQQHQMQPQPY